MGLMACLIDSAVGGEFRVQGSGSASAYDLIIWKGSTINKGAHPRTTKESWRQSTLFSVCFSDSCFDDDVRQWRETTMRTALGFLIKKNLNLEILHKVPA